MRYKESHERYSGLTALGGCPTEGLRPHESLGDRTIIPLPALNQARFNASHAWEDCSFITTGMRPESQAWTFRFECSRAFSFWSR